MPPGGSDFCSSGIGGSSLSCCGSSPQNQHEGDIIANRRLDQVDGLKGESTQLAYQLGGRCGRRLPRGKYIVPVGLRLDEVIKRPAVGKISFGEVVRHRSNRKRILIELT